MNYLCADWQIAQKAFGDPPVIRIRRRDRLRQAISNYIAEQTDVYHMAREDDADDPFLGWALKPKQPGYNQSVPFDFEAIRRYVHLLGDQEQYWDEAHARAGTRIFEVFYEDFVADREPRMRALIEFLGIDASSARFDAKEHMAKMSNEVNDRFYEQYRRLDGSTSGN